jgi:nicotinate-nucleotide--dimethylbenzimidazole phosphoribosyltransferase
VAREHIVTESIPEELDLREALQRAIDSKTKPLGSLGRLEALAVQAGIVQRTTRPSIVAPRLAVFAGDHGAADAGVSPYPKEVTRQMVRNFLTGGAAISVLCKRAGLDLVVVDAGVDDDLEPHPRLVDAKIARGTRSYLEAPAMDHEECERALERGAALAGRWADEGCNCIGLGEMGIGNTASASLLTHCLTDAPLESVTGRGGGHDDRGLARKYELLVQAVSRGGRPRDPRRALVEYGGFEIAMLAGAILGAARRRMIILVDGFIVTAAALAARAIEPTALETCVFSHLSDERGHRIQCEALGVAPLLDLGLRLGEGSGAALAFPLVQAAVDILCDMASFESAGVSTAT